MTMTTNNRLADAKRRVQVGERLTLIEAPQWPAMIGVTREVTRVMSGKFALRTVNRDGEIVDSWTDWPKASEMSYDCVTRMLAIGDRVYRIEA